MPKIDWDDTGVYKILNLNTGKVYIGSGAVSIKGRWKDHRNNLRKGTHSNKYLQGSWNKHGENAFLFVVVLFCDPCDCIKHEQIYIDKHKAANPKFGYNRRVKAESNLGMFVRPETGRKISLANKGVKKSREHCLAISKSLRGKKKSETAIRNVANAKRGKKLTDSQKAAISRGLKLAHQIDPSFRLRVANKTRGKKRSQESIEKVRAVHLGRKRSAETCARISAGLKGKPRVGVKHTPEAKVKMSLAAKRRKRDWHGRLI